LLRVIQFTRTNGETDAQLEGKAQTVLAKFHSGDSFAELARKGMQDRGDMSHAANTDKGR